MAADNTRFVAAGSETASTEPESAVALRTNVQSADHPIAERVDLFERSTENFHEFFDDEAAEPKPAVIGSDRHPQDPFRQWLLYVLEA